MPRTAVLYSILRPSVPVRARSAPYGFFSFVGILPPYSESFVPFSPQRFCTKISVISLPFSSESVRHLSFRFIRERSPSFFPLHSGTFVIFLPVSFGKIRHLSSRFIRERSLSFFPFHSGTFVIFLPVSFGKVRHLSSRFIRERSLSLFFIRGLCPSELSLFDFALFRRSANGSQSPFGQSPIPFFFVPNFFRQRRENS